MSMSELDNQPVFRTLNPHALFDQINKAYEEYKHVYQTYDPSKSEVYNALFIRMRKIYEYHMRNRTSDPIYLRLLQEISQFMLELELSRYL
ncbi:MAG: hypothetical protein JW776_09445 [Candidatus Lokiarchaeota archaeon]|nr:hypothetical protein [Candidatus Lokiarchaeota archaeon]